VNDMSAFMAEFKQASEAIAAADSRFDRRLDSFEQSLNELYRKAGRPRGGGDRDDADTERRSAIEMCKVRRSLQVTKDDGSDKEYSPGSAEIEEAIAHRKAFSHVIRHGSPAKLDGFHQKSLSAFSFAGTGMLLPPERMSEVLSCIVYPSDISGLVGRVNISGPSAVFLIENPRMGLGAWACEASCLANNPSPDLAEGLGQLEIKPEAIRFIACATRDFVEDASMNAEARIMRRISEGMAATINNSILIGDGVGKPLGIFHPRSGIQFVKRRPRHRREVCRGKTFIRSSTKYQCNGRPARAFCAIKGLGRKSAR
jgi:HK97 family phage major capsid protein